MKLDDSRRAALFLVFQLGLQSLLGTYTLRSASRYDVEQNVKVLSVHPWAAALCPKQPPLFSRDRSLSLPVQCSTPTSCLLELVLITLEIRRLRGADFECKKCAELEASYTYYSLVSRSKKHAYWQKLSKHSWLPS